LAFVQHALEVSPTIDILVNNAGITYISPAESMDESCWRAVFDVNVHGMMFMSRDVGKVMLAQGRGSIINIGSITSLLAMPGRSAYVTTKVGVLGITRTLAVEWAARGVRVNAVGPGYHRTPLLEKYIENGTVEEDKIRRSIPMGRLGTIDDVGKAVLFFASSLSEYITGQFLMVDGGYTVFGAPEDACS
jgi:gluconate 5-dehydrogenase